MNTAFAESSLIIRSLGWTILHSIWQGALIWACLWVMLKAFTRRQARTRYHVSIAALMLMAICFFNTWVQQWQQLQSTVAHIAETTKNTGLQTVHTVYISAAGNDAEGWLLDALPRMENMFSVIVAIYIAGLILMIVRFCLGLGNIYRLRSNVVSQPSVQLVALFSSLRARLGVAQDVKLLLSAAVHLPLAFGFLKPVVLLPVAMVAQLDMQQIEAILIHELAHIRRQDFIINIFQSIIETVLFFNPFLWWISAGIRKEREYCCDDVVLDNTLQPLPYASALAALEAYRYASSPLAMAALGNNKHQLFNRIKRFNMKRTPFSYTRLAAAVITVCAVTGAVIWFTPAFAQNKKQKTPPKVSRVQKLIIIDDEGNRKEYNSISEMPVSEQEKLKQSMSKVDKSLAELNGQLAPLSDNLSGLDTIMNNVQIRAIVDSALNSVDWNELNQSTRDAMRLARKEMKDIDWDKIDQEMDRAMRELDKVDWDEVAASSGDKKSGAQMKREVRRALRMAREEAFAAQDEHAGIAPIPPMPPMPPASPVEAVPPPAPPLPPAAPDSYTKMLSRMEDDGLIDQNSGFEINKNSRELYINGKAQPDDIKVKYRRFFSPGKVHIKGRGGNLSISATTD